MPSLICRDTVSPFLEPATHREEDAREEALLAHPRWHLSTLLSPASLKHHHTQPDTMLRAVLSEREQHMGAATLPVESMVLLLQLMQEHHQALHVVWHQPTITAQETQATLPPGVVVLKTVTVQLDQSVLLWTRLGHGLLTRTDLRDIARILDLPTRVTSHCQINPRSVDPEVAYGMREGMVSPFLRPHHQTQAQLVAIVSDLTPNTCLIPSPYPEPFQVAISLSRYESLLVPAALFPALLRTYARHAYPHLRFIERSSMNQASAI